MRWLFRKPQAEVIQLKNTSDAGSKNPRRDRRFFHHQRDFLRHVDPSCSIGLEIGAFDLPFVLPEEGHCEFADRRTEDELRSLAVPSTGHSSQYVVSPQYIVRDGYSEIVKTYDWIVAAHLIEHIADPISWLRLIAEKLTAGGLLILVVPDKRYTFDYFRAETTLAQLLGNYRRKLQRPSYSQVFDHFFNCVETKDGRPISSPRFDYRLADVEATRAEHEFVDAHCSVFTSDSFSSLVRHLNAAGLIPFSLQEINSTLPANGDFSAFLKKG